MTLKEAIDIHLLNLIDRCDDPDKMYIHYGSKSASLNQLLADFRAEDEFHTEQSFRGLIQDLINRDKTLPTFLQNLEDVNYESSKQ